MPVHARVFSLQFYVHIKAEEAIKIFVSWTCINEELYTYKEGHENDARESDFKYEIIAKNNNNNK